MISIMLLLLSFPVKNGDLNPNFKIYQKYEVFKIEFHIAVIGVQYVDNGTARPLLRQTYCL